MSAAQALEQLVAELVERKVAERIAEITRKPPTMITIAEYAAQRSISEALVRAAIEDGRLPARQYGETVQPKGKARGKVQRRALRVPADVEIGELVRPAEIAAAEEDENAFAARIGRKVVRR